MSEISISTCTVNLAGDVRSVVTRGPTRPVTWPEVEVLMYVHGDDAVNNIEVIDKGDTTIAEEFDRLTARYGKDVTTALFPGKRPAMVLKAPDSVSGARATAKKSKAAGDDPF